ncbi:MAG TPA: Uma2 family endonuclease [Blastocatellia bacterium]|nr:Uma2 family endonuclease [Blastocatellia bacterium]
MGLPEIKSCLSPEEYLELERAALNEKHEYHDGQLYAMAGETASHGRIKSNLVREIGLKLKAKNCDVFTADMKVCITRVGPYVYPDIVIVCGQSVFFDDTEDMLVNPHTVIEVLSSSTQAYDGNGKFDLYQQVESLTTYVLVAQHRPQVTVMTRQSRRHWDLRLLTDLEDEMKLEKLRCTIPMAEIYRRVKFPKKAETGQPFVPAKKPARKRARKS